MQVDYDKQFIKEATKLPAARKKLLANKLSYLAISPFDSRLHTKQLSSPLTGVFSFRISREYRVLFRFITAEQVFLLSVKHRKDVYR